MTTATAARPAPSRLAWLSVLWIGGMHAGAILALFPAYFSWSAVLICLFLHWLTGGIGICLTYHRLLTHRSFTLWPKWLEYPLTIIGTMASEGGAIGWVADHRRHHAYSDEDDDTHTPREGFFWAHMGWWMKVDDSSRHTPEYYNRWAPDLYKDPVHRWIDGNHILFPIGLMVAPLWPGRNALADLGRVSSDDPRAAHDLAGELGQPHLGLPLAPDPRQVHQPLVGGPADLRRRVAQQPPRVPDLGPTRPGAGGRSTSPTWRSSSCRIWAWPATSSFPGSPGRRERILSPWPRA